MVTWELVSFLGLGSLRFGMTREEAQCLLGPSSKQFKKTYSSLSLTDEYRAIGVHLYYDQDGRLEFIEGFPPCRVVFRMTPLFEGTPEAIIRSLEQMGFQRRISGATYVFDDAGFALIVEDIRITGVSVFAKDYYAKCRKLVKVPLSQV